MEVPISKPTTILEFLPIPSTIGTPPTGSPSDVGGTIYSMPTGKLNRFASLLRIACKIVETLERERKNIKDITQIGLGSIEPTRAKLESIDFNLFEFLQLEAGPISKTYFSKNNMARSKISKSLKFTLMTSNLKIGSAP